MRTEHATPSRWPCAAVCSGSSSKSRVSDRQFRVPAWNDTRPRGVRVKRRFRGGWRTLARFLRAAHRTFRVPPELPNGNKRVCYLCAAGRLGCESRSCGNRGFSTCCGSSSRPPGARRAVDQSVDQTYGVTGCETQTRARRVPPFLTRVTLCYPSNVSGRRNRNEAFRGRGATGDGPSARRGPGFHAPRAATRKRVERGGTKAVEGRKCGASVRCA